MSLFAYAVLGVLLVITSSCERTQSKELDPLQANVKEFLEAYCSSNRQTAEQALLKERQRFVQWQMDGVNYDYDELFGVNDARLYSFYSTCGSNEIAMVYFDSCTNHLTGLRIAHGYDLKTYSEADVRSAATLADKGLHVGWRN